MDIGGLNISAGSIDQRLSARTPIAGLSAAQDDFSSILSRKRSDPNISIEQQTRESAQDFVAIALVQPVLKQLRDSDRTPAPFGPGPGEKQFRQIADGAFARQLVRKSNWGLVDRISKMLLDKAKGTSPQWPMPKYGPNQDRIVPTGAEPAKEVSVQA
jgi:Rod binding domain-containing protein